MFSSKFSFTVMLTGLLVSHSTLAQILNIDPQTVEAEAWVILDPQSQQIVAAHNENVRRAPASLTKMMVGYLTIKALQNNQLKLDQLITVPEIVKTVAGDESKLRIKPNEQITVEQLLSSLIIMSANDSALTLGITLAGDLPRFIDLMNQTAKELGMNNTHFSNASGITMEDHYSSAQDLALLAQAIVLNTPTYLGYSKQPEFSYKDIHHRATNLLLNRDPSVDGLKTGFTAAAGYNLALTAQRIDVNTQQNRRLVVIVLGTASKYKRADVAHALINIAFNYTQTKQLFNKDHLIAALPVLGGKDPIYNVTMAGHQTYNTVSLLPESQILNVKNFDNAQQRFIIDPTLNTTLEPLTEPRAIEYKIELLKDKLNAPLHETAYSLATVKVLQFGEQLHAIAVNNDVELVEANLWQKIVNWFKALFSGSTHQLQKPVIYQIPA